MYFKEKFYLKGYGDAREKKAIVLQKPLRRELKGRFNLYSTLKNVNTPLKEKSTRSFSKNRLYVQYMSSGCDYFYREKSIT